MGRDGGVRLPREPAVRRVVLVPRCNRVPRPTPACRLHLDTARCGQGGAGLVAHRRGLEHLQQHERGELPRVVAGAVTGGSQRRADGGRGGGARRRWHPVLWLLTEQRLQTGIHRALHYEALAHQSYTPSYSPLHTTTSHHCLAPGIDQRGGEVVQPHQLHGAGILSPPPQPLEGARGLLRPRPHLDPPAEFKRVCAALGK